MNFNRMTIRQTADGFAVFKMKSQHTGYATDMAGKKHVWFVSAAAAPRFTGTHAACHDFITAQGAQFMSEHTLPV